MRTYGKDTNGVWVEVSTTADGHDDYVWITTLAQCLKLTPGESPFFAAHGIPAQQSIVTQVFPDYYVAQMQSLFAQYFASLTIGKVSNPEDANPSNPSYDISIVTNRGVVLNQTIAT